MADMANDNLIELKHVRKVFDEDTVVVEDFSLDIKKGEFVTFLGPSGCGKTTILRMLGGFDVPSGGEILLNGDDITKLPPNERPINTVFQKYALFPHLNVYDNIAFGLKLKKMAKKEMDEKVSAALEIVDLEGFEKRNINTLSGGQQQRIAIARAIVNEPELLLLDEPLSALDAKMRKEMQIELKNMHKKLGITFIFVTHDQEEALTMSDKIVVMADGEIQQVGTPEEIYNEPANLFVADFIGESNIFKGKMVGKKKANFAGYTFDCVDDYEVGTVIDAVIRPEDFMITTEEKGQIKGEILSSDFKGTFYIVSVLSGKNEIEVHSLKNYDIGAKVGLCLEPDLIHIIPYDTSINHYEAMLGAYEVERGLPVQFADFSWDIDPEQIFPGCQVEDGVLMDAHGKVIETEGMIVDAFFSPDDLDLSDDAEAGVVTGNILSFLYVDDHYQYTVRSESEEDYVVNDEDLWNQEDYVSIIIPKDKVVYKIINS
ncbi:MAG: ABC transporter ATP-binding protein [Lachnospiraceae bacterium]|nr:ABC transporter ATP-binding protein [Lachnospiraceae bacterium]